MSFNSTDGASTMMASGVVAAFLLTSLAQTIGVMFLLGFPIVSVACYFDGSPNPFFTEPEPVKREKGEGHEASIPLFIAILAPGLMYIAALGSLEAVFLACNISIMRLVVTDSPTLQNTDFIEWWVHCLKGLAILVAMIFGLCLIYPVGELLTRPWRNIKCSVCAAREAEGQTEPLPGHEACAADKADEKTQTLPSYEA